MQCLSRKLAPAMVSKHSCCLSCIVNLPCANNTLGIVNAGIGEEVRATTRGFGKVGTVFRAKTTDSSNAKTSLTMDRSC